MKTLILLFSVLIITMSFAQVPNYVPANGLVGYWPFNGNANDESGNGNNGTNNGASLTNDRTGNASSAYEFFGSNWIECAYNPILNVGTGSFTISCWATKVGGNTFQHFVTRNEITSYPNATTSYGLRYQFSGVGMYSSGNLSSSNGSIATSALLNLSNWNYFVGVYNSVNATISIYVNGVLSIFAPIESNPQSYNNNGGLFFGVEHPTVSLPSGPNFLTGKLDDIGIWNRALTACEIQNLYTSTNPINLTSQTACDSYTWNGQAYTQSGVYTGPTANCVTESLNLTITPSSTNTTTASACDSYTWNGQAYTQSGVYTGPTANCVTESLNLTITPSSTNTTSESACDSYTWNGTNYTASGVYTGTTANCITESLNLTITPSSTNTTTASACNSLTWNGQTYTQSGVYIGTTTNCITQALNLTINTNTSSSISQTALDSYTWPVNNQTYTTTGAYTTVIPNASGCDSTITLNLTMSFTGINDLSASKLSIYPNPTNGDFTITGLELVGTVSSLILTDMNGKVVKILDAKVSKFSMASIKPGVYFLNIISGNKQEVLKIVKE